MGYEQEYTQSRRVGFHIRSFYVFSRSYFIAVHTVFKPIYSHSVRIYRLKEKTVPYIKNWRNSHYWLYEIVFIIFRLSFFV